MVLSWRPFFSEILARELFWIRLKIAEKKSLKMLDFVGITSHSISEMDLCVLVGRAFAGTAVRAVHWQ